MRRRVPGVSPEVTLGFTCLSSRIGASRYLTTVPLITVTESQPRPRMRVGMRVGSRVDNSDNMAYQILAWIWMTLISYHAMYLFIWLVFWYSGIFHLCATIRRLLISIPHTTEEKAGMSWTWTPSSRVGERPQRSLRCNRALVDWGGIYRRTPVNLSHLLHVNPKSLNEWYVFVYKDVKLLKHGG